MAIDCYKNSLYWERALGLCLRVGKDEEHIRKLAEYFEGS